jgi:hypothetical protein
MKFDPDGQLSNLLAGADDLDTLARILAKLFDSRFDVLDDGRLYVIKRQVDRIGNLRIEIRSDEHPPPHFHIVGPEIDASYTIEDCSRLNGNLDARKERLLRKWFRGCRSKLIQIWNDSRPGDCPVGETQW